MTDFVELLDSIEHDIIIQETARSLGPSLAERFRLAEGMSRFGLLNGDEADRLANLSRRWLPLDVPRRRRRRSSGDTTRMHFRKPLKREMAKIALEIIDAEGTVTPARMRQVLADKGVKVGHYYEVTNLIHTMFYKGDLKRVTRGVYTRPDGPS